MDTDARRRDEGQATLAAAIVASCQCARLAPEERRLPCGSWKLPPWLLSHKQPARTSPRPVPACKRGQKGALARLCTAVLRWLAQRLVPGG